jgi:hypothetical protein
MSFVAIGCFPFMVLGGFMNSKLQTGLANEDEKAYKDANLLAGDAILNYRTVASLSSDKQIVKEYESYIMIPVNASVRSSYQIGFWFGFS